MEDKLLIWKLNRGGKKVLCRIYEKYRDDLVRIAAGLIGDIPAAEDMVQEVFLKMVHNSQKFRITKNLKGYLITCVVNNIRTAHRANKINSVSFDNIPPAASLCESPDFKMAADEQSTQLYTALAELPYDQKEAVLLKIQGNMKFKEIAKIQNVSTKTALSRYYYGLNKLRSILKNEVEK